MKESPIIQPQGTPTFLQSLDVLLAAPGVDSPGPWDIPVMSTSLSTSSNISPHLRSLNEL